MHAETDARPAVSLRRAAPHTVAIVMPLGERRGGGEAMLLDLLRDGPAGGVRWIVILLQPGPLEEELAALGVETAVLSAGRLRQVPRTAATVARIAGIVRHERIGTVVGWMSKGQLYAGLVALTTGARVLWYQLGTPANPGIFDRLATILPSQVVAVCSSDAAGAQSALRPRRQVRVVYPGVDVRRFSAEALPPPLEARRLLGLPEDGPLVGMVGRLQRWKGMHILVEAMPEVLRHRPDSTCVLVGGVHELEPDYPVFLEARIAALGLASRVVLTGLQQDAQLWMQAMDVVVHASRREPFGIVVVEAMALGKPVVATNQGGPAEIITPGVDGLLIPFDEPAALADAILRYLDDPAFAHELGAAARLRAQTFSTREYAAGLTGLVHELASAPR